MEPVSYTHLEGQAVKPGSQFPLQRRQIWALSLAGEHNAVNVLAGVLGHGGQYGLQRFLSRNIHRQNLIPAAAQGEELGLGPVLLQLYICLLYTSRCV